MENEDTDVGKTQTVGSIRNKLESLLGQALLISHPDLEDLC